MSAIGNFLWFFIGGAVMGLGWWTAGLICALTVIGLPWAKACFVIGQFAFFPFGREAIARNDLSGRDDIGTGAWGTLGNVLWFLAVGIWLVFGHLVAAVGCFVTLIGIPFAIQHLKLAGLALAPIGKTIVTRDEAAAARLLSAQLAVAKRRS